MKSIIAIAAGMLAFALTVSFAHAAPTAVRDSGSQIAYGTETALAVDKDTSAGYNRTAVKYPSGWQYVTDDAAWTRFAATVAGLTKPVVAPTTGRVYDAAKAIIGCNGNQSYVSWPTAGQPEYVPDSCALRNAAVSVAN